MMTTQLMILLKLKMVSECGFSDDNGTIYAAAMMMMMMQAMKMKIITARR